MPHFDPGSISRLSGGPRFQSWPAMVD